METLPPIVNNVIKTLKFRLEKLYSTYCHVLTKSRLDNKTKPAGSMRSAAGFTFIYDKD